MNRTKPHPPTISHNQLLGARGEIIAAGYLEGLGFSILERNWRNRNGELDLIARDGNALVAVEVKTRSGTAYGNPLEAITVQKMARLRRLLLDWVRETNARGTALRVDAVGITLRGDERPRIDHLRGVS
jgi:putative endonuclease